ncbi:ABC transporter permease [Streptomonospora algeriensis]|uniref:ABC transporter permease n=1 Tax=Streptomonospora algeriensis TaxID=995084 RepID=A0ABW3BEJ2_9ACTN
MTTHQTAAAPPTGASGARQRRPVGALRQTLRLTRTEFTLIHRYRTALFFVLFPLVFVFLGTVTEGESPIPGISYETLALTGSPAAIVMMIGIMHVSNTYAARREQLILKRFRASGVPPVALFGATTLSVLAVVLLLTAVPVGVLIAGPGELPTDPVMMALALVLSTVTMVLLGAASTRLARNAESAQMISMVPFLVLYLSSGLMLPLEILPDELETVCRLLPMAPVVELLRGGYTGHDVFGGLAGASPATGLELWAAALPSLAVVLAWTALSVLSLRYFRWDPRQPM